MMRVIGGAERPKDAPHDDLKPCADCGGMDWVVSHRSVWGGLMMGQTPCLKCHPAICPVCLDSGAYLTPKRSRGALTVQRSICPCPAGQELARREVGAA